MKQWDAIEKVLEKLREDPAIEAVFLKGSLGRQEGDEFSDVDLYCMVRPEMMDAYLPKRLNYLQAYRPLVYWSESNFVGPQIVAVFDDGLHFDLYAVTRESLRHTDQVLPLYDPQDLLAGYVPEPLGLPADEIVTTFNSFCFSLVEFEANYGRKHLLWATRLASHLSADLSLLLRYRCDPDRAQLACKGLDRVLDPETAAEFQRVLDLLHPASLLAGMLALIDLFRTTAREIEAQGKIGFDWKFFEFMQARIRALAE
jgi:hypothetical protein